MSTGIALAEEIGWRGYLLPHLLPLGHTRALLVRLPLMMCSNIGQARVA